MIDHWYDNVVFLSVRLFVHLSVTLCIVAKRCILQQVSEQVKRKCPLRNTILQL